MKDKPEFDLENRVTYMDDARFNAIFNEDLDDDYDNIIERVVDHIIYRGDYDNDGSGGDVDDGANDDNDGDDDSDEDDESFWRREFDMKNDLERMYGLKPSRRMSVIEKVVIFLYTIALGASNREVQERFQHSDETLFKNPLQFTWTKRHKIF
uniref:DUF8040 domain-containing protein n=1 Tax=Populus trichocarpa TaxID=3694 RepID=A0A2K2C0D7_POPTR